MFPAAIGSGAPVFARLRSATFTIVVGFVAPPFPGCLVEAVPEYRGHGLPGPGVQSCIVINNTRLHAWPQTMGPKPCSAPATICSRSAGGPPG